EANEKLYDDAMAEARTAIAADDWQKALEAHQQADGIRQTDEARDAITRDKNRLGQIQSQDQKQKYTQYMDKAATAVAAGQWQDALDAYRAAYQYQKTQVAADGITKSTKMLNDVAYNKKQYDKAMADASTAAATGAWPKALAAYQQAAAIDATADAKAGVQRAQTELANAAAAQKKQQYTTYMSAGEAGAKAGDWKKALAS